MWIYVAVGGMLGTLGRYGLQGLVHGRSATFPTGTLIVNVLGSLVLGFVARYAAETTVVSPEVRAGLTIGVCGGFTTMSSFAYETIALLGDSQYMRAAFYLLATIIGSLIAVAAGAMVAEKLL
jgi:CrcB protein